ncbi:M20/M25/M40 family metallo-hydrolase [Cytobacillus gottheilii]|uniref:M20/M25/M40 family metallo-hydrolase n=1 Tax=Cytobacillus gottheilii TaxID=859144 RepID=UPI003CF8C87F
MVYGETAYEHLKQLNAFGSRVAGTEDERAAESYIKGEFEKIGLETSVQPFSFTRGGTSINSANVIGFKQGKSSKEIIVGAHYDAVSAGKGIDDNASGVGVLLEAAKALKDIETPYSIRFVSFGAEEVGLQGSKYYANQMDESEISNTVGMINLDSLAAGDHMYVYGGAGEAGFIRDLALEIVDEKDLNIGTNPGENPAYPAGTTGDWSDHAPFKNLGIPYGYFEATNWDIGDKDGYVQTVEHGAIFHTKNDTLEFIESAFPGRVKEHLSSFSLLLQELLKSLGSK